MMNRPSLEFIVEAMIASLAINGRMPNPSPVNWVIGALRNAQRDGHTFDELAHALDAAAGAACDLDALSSRRQIAPDHLLEMIDAAPDVFVRASISIAHLDAAQVPYIRVGPDQARQLIAGVDSPTMFWVMTDPDGTLRIG